MKKNKFSKKVQKQLNQIQQVKRQPHTIKDIPAKVRRRFLGKVLKQT
jgi:hypothetical protein